jgi:hypothetical protein
MFWCRVWSTLLCFHLHTHGDMHVHSKATHTLLIINISFKLIFNILFILVFLLCLKTMWDNKLPLCLDPLHLITHVFHHKLPLMNKLSQWQK